MPKLRSVQLAGFELEPAFDQRALRIYVALVLVLALGALLFFATGLRLAVSVFPPLWTAALIIGGIMAQRIGLARTSAAMQTIGLTYAQGLGFLLLIYGVIPISLPMADATLAQADKLLGLDWLGYAAFVHWHPDLLAAMRISYGTFGWQPIVLLSLVAWSGQVDRCWTFIYAEVISLVAAVALFALFPAVGTLRYYNVQPAYLPLHEGWNFGPVIQAIKAGHHTIDQSMIAGVISFPSCHAMSAILFSWLVWKTPWRWIIVPFEIFVLAGTPIVGAHYFIDVIGGVALAAASIAAARHQANFR